MILNKQKKKAGGKIHILTDLSLHKRRKIELRINPHFTKQVAQRRVSNGKTRPWLCTWKPCSYWMSITAKRQSEGIYFKCFMMLLVSLTLISAALLGSSGSLGIQQPGAPHLHQEQAEEGLMAGIWSQQHSNQRGDIWFGTRAANHWNMSGRNAVDASALCLQSKEWISLLERCAPAMSYQGWGRSGFVRVNDAHLWVSSLCCAGPKHHWIGSHVNNVHVTAHAKPGRVTETLTPEAGRDKPSSTWVNLMKPNISGL